MRNFAYSLVITVAFGIVAAPAFAFDWRADQSCPGDSLYCYCKNGHTIAARGLGEDDEGTSAYCTKGWNLRSSGSALQKPVQSAAPSMYIQRSSNTRQNSASYMCANGRC